MKSFPKKALLYPGILLLVMVSYLLLRVLGWEQGGMKYIRYGNLLFQFSAFIILWKDCLRGKEKNTYTEAQITGLILAMGIAMRVVYMLYTPCDDYLVDAAQTVSCVASCYSLIISWEIFRECNLKEKELYRSLLLVAFLPVYFLTGGRIGTDALCGMFMLLAFLYTLKWVREKNWKNTLVLAVIYAFGMMTGMSMATLAIFTAVIFIGSFLKACKNGTWKGLLLKYVAFAAISFPIGLWYGMHNYILFKQPFTYIQPILQDDVRYKGTMSVWQRIFLLDVGNLFRTPYIRVQEDYNLPVYALKSSLFGEFTFECWGWIPTALLFFATVLAGFGICAVVHYIRYKEKDRERNLCLLAAGIYWLSIVIFYLRHPYGCSMDFRYMLFLPVPIAVLFGRCEKMNEGRTGMGLRLTGLWVMGFAISSCLMYG